MIFRCLNTYVADMDCSCPSLNFRSFWIWMGMLMNSPCKVFGIRSSLDNLRQLGILIGRITACLQGIISSSLYQFVFSVYSYSMEEAVEGDLTFRGIHCWLINCVCLSWLAYQKLMILSIYPWSRVLSANGKWLSKLTKAYINIWCGWGQAEMPLFVDVLLSSKSTW